MTIFTTLYNHINFSIVLFLFFLCLYSIGSFMVLYHLIRFGIGVPPKIVALAYFIGSVLLLFMLVSAYAFVDVSDAKQLLQQWYSTSQQPFR